jgi:hypothetical protein
VRGRELGTHAKEEYGALILGREKGLLKSLHVDTLRYDTCAAIEGKPMDCSSPTLLLTACPLPDLHIYILSI